MVTNIWSQRIKDDQYSDNTVTNSWSQRIKDGRYSDDYQNQVCNRMIYPNASAITLLLV